MQIPEIARHRRKRNLPILKVLSVFRVSENNYKYPAMVTRMVTLTC